MAKCCCGLIGGCGDDGIGAGGGKSRVGVDGENQEHTCRCDIGWDADGQTFLTAADVVGIGVRAIAQDEVDPPAAAVGEAIQAVGVAGHAVGTVAKAEGLPHEPQAAGGTEGHPGIGDGEDEEGDIERRDAGR